MGRLARLALCISAPSFCLSPAIAKTVRWSGEVREASQRFKIPEEWIFGVIAVESGGKEFLAGRPIISRSGAMGLMQLMPETWTEMRIAHRLGENPFDARDNILAGTAYLRAMFDRFGYPGLFAAYNAGPTRYARLLAVGRELPQETVAYLAKLTRCEATARKVPSWSHCRQRRQSPGALPNSLFALYHERAADPVTDVSQTKSGEPPASKPGRKSFSRTSGLGSNEEGGTLKAPPSL